MKTSSLVISRPVAMLQLFFFLKSYFIRRRLLSSTTLGRQHTPLHNLIMTQTELGVAQCGHSPDLLYTSSLRVKPVVVNPRKILCTFFFLLCPGLHGWKNSRWQSSRLVRTRVNTAGFNDTHQGFVPLRWKTSQTLLLFTAGPLERLHSHCQHWCMNQNPLLIRLLKCSSSHLSFRHLTRRATWHHTLCAPESKRDMEASDVNFI